MKLSKLITELRYVSFKSPGITIAGITVDYIDMLFEEYDNNLNAVPWSAELPDGAGFIVFDVFEGKLLPESPKTIMVGADDVSVVMLPWDRKPNWWEKAEGLLEGKLVKHSILRAPHGKRN